MRIRRYRHLFGRFGRTRRWRRRILLAGLVFLLLLASGLFFITRPQRLAALSAAMLTDLIGAPVHCGHARIGLDGSIHLRDVRLSLRPDRGPQDTLFAAEEVLVRHELMSLLGGHFRARALTFINPTLHLIEDTATGQFSYQRLERRTPVRTPDELPEIRVRGGRLIFGQIDAGAYNRLGIVRLSGALVPKPADPQRYQFQFQQELPGGQPGPVLSGDLDLARLALSARLDRFAFEAPQRIILPSRFRQWWDLLEPAGSFPVVSFAYAPDLGVHAVLDVKDAQLTLPYGSLKPRLSGVSGRFKLTRQRISVENLRGAVEGLTCTVDGDIDGFDVNAPFNLHVRVDPFAVPASPPALPNLPDFVKKVYERYNPSGVVKASVRMQRRESGGRLSYSGTASFTKGSGRYYRFPYPFHDVQGEIRFNDEKIEIASLTARGPTGGKVSITGAISPPGDGAAVHMVITGVDFPVDEHLRAAMPPKQAAALRLFADPAQHQRLIDRGLIQTTAQSVARRQALEELEQQRRRAQSAQPAPQPAALADMAEKIAQAKKLAAVPVFDLGGRINLVVNLHRPLGMEAQYATTVDVQVNGGQAVMTAWPYPLALVRGKIRIEPHLAIIEGVEARGPTGALGVINGKVAFDDASGLSPDVKVVGVNVPVDPFLLAAMAPPQDHWLELLNLQGRFDISGNVTRAPAGGVDFAFRTQVANAQARPLGGGYALDKLAATVDIRRGRFDIVEAQAYHGKTLIKASGQTRFEGARPAFDLQVNAAEVNLRDPLFELLPPGHSAAADIKKQFAAHDLRGVVDAALRYRTASDPAQQAELDLQVRPRWLGVNLGQGSVDLKDFRGFIRVEESALRLVDCSASVGDARINASGSMRFLSSPAGPRGVDLTLALKTSDVECEALKLFPPAVAQAVRSIELRGPAELSAARVIYRPETTTGQQVDFTGRLTLANARANLTAAVTELHATADITATLAPRAASPRLDLKIRAPSLRLADRHVEALTVRLVSAQNEGQLSLEQFSGSLYGGTIVGMGVVGVGQGAPYRLSLNLADVSLEPLLHPRAGNGTQAATTAPAATAPASQPPTASRPGNTGSVDASLSLEGVNGAPDERRGRGRVEVRNARLYELPFALAMLQILNLSLPTARSFDTASADYRLEGDIVRVDTLRFESPNLLISGDGALRLSDRRLALDLTSRRRTGPRLGPITDILEIVKDELVSIHVGGTLVEPQVQVRSLQGLRRTVDDIFRNPRDAGSAAPFPRANTTGSTAPSPAPLAPRSPQPLVGVPATSDQ